MMAAAARTSGTSCPESSTVKRGVCTSRRSRMRAVARACATRARRALATEAEYDRLVAVADLLVGFACARVTAGRVERLRDADDGDEEAETGVFGAIRASATMSAGTNRSLLRKAAHVI